jgi:DNA (cytosine-5)-methyltransferase 1
MKKLMTPEDLINFRAKHGLSIYDLGEILQPEISVKAGVQKIYKWEKGEIQIPQIINFALKGLELELLEAKKISRKKNHNKKFTFIDLFSGIGGMRMPFESLGGECAFSSEWDPYPAKMYHDNFGEKPAGDITKIHAQDIPQHDLLIGGFPCQPFSLAGVSKKNSLGRDHGFKDKTQGTLFFDVARIIEYHRPKAFLLENVKNIISHDKGNTFKTIIETLREELGYKVNWQVIDAQNFVPQHRERVYIVGFLPEHAAKFKFPNLPDKEYKLDDILINNSEVDPKYTLSDRLWTGLQRHANKHKELGNGFGFGLVDGSAIARTLSARYYKDGSEILIKQKNKNPRRLTPRECARLMGFPEDFQITVSDTRAYKCFGNSVVVPAISWLAKDIVKCLIAAISIENRSNLEIEI